MQEQSPTGGPVYLINSYDIDDPAAFAPYPPKVGPILKRYGAEVLVSDIAAKALEGRAKTMNAIIRFPSEEAVLNCYNDPEYVEIRKLRQNSTSHCSMVVTRAFTPATFIPPSFTPSSNSSPGSSTQPG